MTDTPTRIEINCATGEATIVALSADEIAERELLAAQAETERIEREALEAQKAQDKADAITTLTGLGLTEAQISALIG